MHKDTLDACHQVKKNLGEQHNVNFHKPNTPGPAIVEQLDAILLHAYGLPATPSCARCGSFANKAHTSCERSEIGNPETRTRKLGNSETDRKLGNGNRRTTPTADQPPMRRRRARRRANARSTRNRENTRASPVREAKHEIDVPVRNVTQPPRRPPSTAARADPSREPHPH